jgi:hypothetical protein
MAVDLAQIEFPDLAAGRTHVLEPGQPGGERGPEGRINSSSVRAFQVSTTFRARVMTASRLPSA